MRHIYRDPGSAVEVFVQREAAAQFLREAIADVPEWTELLSVARIDLSGPEPVVTPPDAPLHPN